MGAQDLTQQRDADLPGVWGRVGEELDLRYSRLDSTLERLDDELAFLKADVTLVKVDVKALNVDLVARQCLTPSERALEDSYHRVDAQFDRLTELLFARRRRDREGPPVDDLDEVGVESDGQLSPAGAAHHSQAISLDDRTIAIYSALDSATLLALLPTLRYEAARTKEETDTFERVRQSVPKQMAGVAGVTGETTARERRSGEASPREQPELLRRARDPTASDDELGKVLDRLDRYRSDLLERERCIRAELMQRGLLPECPFWGER